MTRKTSDHETIENLSFIINKLNRYIPIVLLILGSIDHILNIIIFTCPLFETNPSPIYLISGSIASFVSLYVDLITPFLATYNLDPTQKSNILCVFICVNQQLHFQHAKRTIVITIIICFICPYSQVFYCYTISRDNICTQTNQTCKVVNDIILILCNFGLPPILMVTIDILTIRNVQYLDQNFSNCRRRDIHNCIIFYTYALTSKTYRNEAFRILSSLFKRCRSIKINPVQNINASRINQHVIAAAVVDDSYQMNIQNRNEKVLKKPYSTHSLDAVSYSIKMSVSYSLVFEFILLSDCDHLDNLKRQLSHYCYY
ncbi:unnamed protein product [Rotaria magnacalcarata]